MKKLGLLLVALVAVPTLSLAGTNHMKHVSAKKIENGHAFLYECAETGNIIEVEQRYNPNAKAEEIRFVVNGAPDEWITEINGDIYNYFSKKACEESTTRVATLQ